MQVYYKRGDVPDLRPYESRLLEIRCMCLTELSFHHALDALHCQEVADRFWWMRRERLAGPGCLHMLPFQAFLESDKAAYLIRPYIFADLYHRLSTRPFLSAIEKACVTSCSLTHGRF